MRAEREGSSARDIEESHQFLWPIFSLPLFLTSRRLRTNQSIILRYFFISHWSCCHCNISLVISHKRSHCKWRSMLLNSCAFWVFILRILNYMVLSESIVSLINVYEYNWNAEAPSGGLIYRCTKNSRI